MRLTYAMMAVGLALLFGGGAGASTSDCAGVIYLALRGDGSILVNEKLVAPAALSSTLGRLQPSAKFVLY
ncbi:MAG: hypothetical protein ACRECA_11580, partial [Pseudolabrys sp.]